MTLSNRGNRTHDVSERNFGQWPQGPLYLHQQGLETKAMKNIENVSKGIDIETVIKGIKNLDNPGKIILIGGLGIAAIGLGIEKLTEVVKTTTNHIGGVES